MKTFKALIFVVYGFCINGFAQNIYNPVLPGVADAGVIKYNGEYYIGGVGTNGDFYISDDLVHWSKPVHVVSMKNDWTNGTGAGDDQIHANNMLYDNGIFHLYWSVNYWGKDKNAVHITHATSNDILGPYIEPNMKTWMDNRIDPHVFKDDDGSFYMYMVRFTDGNTIWGRKMNRPSEFLGEPICMFSSLPNTWETMDNRVAEGPCVIKYRNKYYMMYNANHTSTDWGNYQLGVAVSDSPLGFQNGNKYSYPIVKSNQVSLEESHQDVLRYGELYNPYFSYTDKQPAVEWINDDFNEVGWKKGECGFASEDFKGSTVKKKNTHWNSEKLWLRKLFDIKDINHNYALRVMHGGATKIFLNGVMIYNKQNSDYCLVNLDAEQLKNLKIKNNLLAIETSGNGDNNIFDIALFDMDNEKGENILFSPGQPNIIRGINGFEWWLVYMANRNNEQRGQYINRVHFFDKTLYVDGITDCMTDGYHPNPSMPTFRDLFDDKHISESKWQFYNGHWKILDGELLSMVSEPSYALLNTRKSSTYLFETSVSTKGNAGVIAWWNDSSNYIKIGFDFSRKAWCLTKIIDNKEEKQYYLLSDSFRWGVYHNVRVERNMDMMKVYIDDIPSTGKYIFTGLPEDKGIPGLFSENSCSRFDGVIYTIGFDDYDEYMPKWHIKTGDFTNSHDGLKTSSEYAEAFKGEKSRFYEFEVQITNTSKSGKAGIYPVYVDSKNYVRAYLDAEGSKMVVTVIKNGKVCYNEKFDLSVLKTLYSDVKYTDFIEKGYSLQCPTKMNAIYLDRHNVDDGIYMDDMFSYLNIEYLSDGDWYPLYGKVSDSTMNVKYNKLSFDNIWAERFRFLNKNPEDYNRHIYKIRINELWKESYNIRSVREDNKLFLFVDGKKIVEIPILFEESYIGLYSEDGCISYNGALYYHK